MESGSVRPYLVTIVLMGLTSLALAFTVDVDGTDEAGVSMMIPEHVGDWTGHDLLYCVDASCREAVLVDAGFHSDHCPVCAAELDVMSPAERKLLPTDTGMARKQFIDPRGRTVTASIVLAGKERVSIHRPQICLTGSGHDIERTKDIQVPIAGRRPLRVRVLDLDRRAQTPDGRTMVAPSYYAYWFAGKDRETPLHMERMFYMAADRVLRNVSHQWAYISVAGLREPGSDAHLDEIRRFVHDFYPQIALR
jgi:hypothetical protein